MSRELVLRPAARREFDEAVGWYEAQRSGLGREFVAEVERVLAAIRRAPNHYAVVHRDLRAALVRRFPYTLYFRVESGATVVVAIIHSARDPALWRGRH